MPNAPMTDPTAIYRYRETLAAVDALTAAIVHLDLFTALADNPADLVISADAITQYFAQATFNAARGLAINQPRRPEGLHRAQPAAPLVRRLSRRSR